MKRYLLLILLISANAFPGAFVTLKAPIFGSCNGNMCAAQTNPQISLLIMEPINEKWEFKSWSGYVPTFWAESDNGFFYTLNDRTKVGAEVDFSHSMVPAFASDYMSVRAVVEFKLW